MKVSTTLAAAASATVALTLASLPAAAHVGGNFEKRIDRQADRIQQGVRSGSLTRFEAVRLRAQNRRIARQLRGFVRDGRLTPHERRRMNTMLQNANNAIYAQKHDNQSRRGRGAGYGNHQGAKGFNDTPWYSYRKYTRRFW